MKKKIVFMAIAVCILLAVTLCAALIGGELSLRGVRRAWSVMTGISVDAAYTFEPGLCDVFADIDGTIVAAGGSGFAAYSRRGEELVRVGYSMKTPAIASGGGLAVVYDIGGHTIRTVYSDGAVAELPVAGEIISVSVGLGGEFAVCTTEKGEYKGRAAFYKMSRGEPVLLYEWYSAEGYVLGAAVSADGKRFAVNTLNANGGRIVFLNAGSEELAAEHINSRGAVLEITFDRGGVLAARTLYDVMLLDPRSSSVVATFDFDGSLPDGYCAAADGFVSVHLESAPGVPGALVSFDMKGRELGRLQTSRRLVSLTARGDRIAALWSDGLDIYDKSLRLIASYPDASGNKYAFSRGGQSAVVMSGRDGRAFAKQEKNGV